MIRVCPKRDEKCPHGMACPYTIDRYTCEREVTEDAGPVDLPLRQIRAEAGAAGDFQKVALVDEIEQLREDAAKWQSLISCDRIRIMGRTLDMNHVGLEFWKKHPSAHPSEDHPQDSCRQVLEEFVGVSADLASLLGWRPIDTLKLTKETGWGFRICAPSLVHSDFNPHGTAEASLENDCDDSPIWAARWNGTQDCWDTVIVTDATHWMPNPLPPFLGGEKP